MVPRTSADFIRTAAITRLRWCLLNDELPDFSQESLQIVVLITKSLSRQRSSWLEVHGLHLGFSGFPGMPEQGWPRAVLAGQDIKSGRPESNSPHFQSQPRGIWGLSEQWQSPNGQAGVTQSGHGTRKKSGDTSGPAGVTRSPAQGDEKLGCIPGNAASRLACIRGVPADRCVRNRSAEARPIFQRHSSVAEASATTALSRARHLLGFTRF